jgi:hypothetical protein
VSPNQYLAPMQFCHQQQTKSSRVASHVWTWI